MEPSPAASSSATPARSEVRPLVVPPGAGRHGAERTESGAGQAQGIKAARAGAQASSGVVLGRVLAPESHDQATATSLLTKRLGVQCSDQSIMPNFSGSWKIIRSENFEDLLKVLGVNVMLRKIAVAAASKPAVEIKQEGDTFYIKTSTTVRTTEINFKIGEEFEEQTVDGRPCKSLVKWESENKMVCEQRLLKGEGPKTSWTRELTNDGELVLTMTADDIVCTRVYVRE